MTQALRIPGPDHPISIEPGSSRMIVKVAGQVIADSRDVLILKEAAYPPVAYIPRQDVDMNLLARSEHKSWCPYKGEASYYGIPSGGDRSANAIWTYEDAAPSVAAIRGHVAFYPDRVDSIELLDA